MTGYVWAIGACYSCRRMFSFDPDLVPSIPINGVREPICRACVEIANPRRVANGLDPIDILPGAYIPDPDVDGDPGTDDDD